MLLASGPETAFSGGAACNPARPAYLEVGGPYDNKDLLEAINIFRHGANVH